MVPLRLLRLVPRPELSRLYRRHCSAMPIKFSKNSPIAGSNPETLLQNIDLIVCDMAGTTVKEGGIVYATIRQVMADDGLAVTAEQMHPWHGAKKEAVFAHFVEAQGTTPAAEVESRVKRYAATFEDKINDAYFNPDSAVALFDGVAPWMESLRATGTKVALDTGYPPTIQKGLIEKLGLDKVVDAHVSSDTVAEGRPYPYMIFKVMSDTRTMDVRRVAKVGDSARDMEEGRNAGCGLVIGVLSGADDEDTLFAAGADVVCNVVTEITAASK